MKKTTIKLLSWFTGSLVGIMTILILILVFPMAMNGFGESIAHLKNQFFVHSNGGNQISDGDFLSNRDFDQMQSVVTPLNKTTLLSENEIDFCAISIEGLYAANCFAEKAVVYGPFGVILNFNRGENANAYPNVAWGNVVDSSADYIRVYSVRENDGQKSYHVIDFSDSHVYFELENDDGSYTVVSQITGDTWLQLAQNNWVANFKEGNGSLMMRSGRYRIVLVMNHKFLCDDGSIEIINTENKVQIYEVLANDDVFHSGILQKKGKQDDYRFQLNFCSNDRSLTYPESQKLTVAEDQLYGVSCSEKDSAKNAKIFLYYFNAQKNEYIKIDEQVLFDSDSKEQKELISLNFGDYGSGIYKIVLEGEFSIGLFKTKKITEEYEYYYSIGELS